MDTLIPLAGIAMIVLIVWMSYLTRQKESKRRAELIGQLIDKFSTGEEFAKAMESPEGWRLAETLSLDQGKSKPTWVGLFIPGAVLVCTGLGFFVLAAIEHEDLVIPGVIISAVGLGLLVSAIVARRAQSKEDNWIDGRTSGASSSDLDTRMGGKRLP